MYKLGLNWSRHVPQGRDDVVMAARIAELNVTIEVRRASVRHGYQDIGKYFYWRFETPNGIQTGSHRYGSAKRAAEAVEASLLATLKLAAGAVLRE